jgi:AcrR family transcriptional regulator
MTGVASSSHLKPASASRRSAAGSRSRARSGQRPGKAKTGPVQPVAKRDQLLETAWRLFYRDGYHATGIDRILAEADVAKMTLYKHFRSKEELILAVLEKRSERFRESVSRYLSAKKRTPEQRLPAVFDWLVDWVKGKEFRGCFFQKAMAEYQDVHDPIHQAALAHKTAFNDEIRRLVADAGLTRPLSLPDQLALLVEGAIVTSHAVGSTMPAVHAREAAQALIKAARRIR